MKQPFLAGQGAVAAPASRGASTRGSPPRGARRGTVSLLRLAAAAAWLAKPAAALSVFRHGVELRVGNGSMSNGSTGSGSLGNGSTSQAGALTAGLPPAPGVTDYSLVGCRKRHPDVAGLSEKDDPLDMTVQRCFLLCKARASVRYFGLEKGRTCWCAPFFSGQHLSDERCDVPCDGDKSKRCGGVAGAASVYVMFDCTPPTEEEKFQEKVAEERRILDSYIAIPKKTCGQAASNRIAVAGSETMVAAMEKCKLACWQASGSMECHGFTFDADTSRCTFHADVFDGNATNKSGSTCFYKRFPV